MVIQHILTKYLDICKIKPHLINFVSPQLTLLNCIELSSLIKFKDVLQSNNAQT